MERIHDRFPITDEQKRYTLATLIFEPDRIARHLGIDQFTAGQQRGDLALLAERGRADAARGSAGDARGAAAMDARLRARPLAIHETTVARSSSASSRTGPRAGSRARPGPWDGRILLAMMDDALRAALHLEAPSKPLERLVRAGARASSPLVLVRPFRSDRSWLDHFGDQAPPARRRSPTPAM